MRLGINKKMFSSAIFARLSPSDDQYRYEQYGHTHFTLATDSPMEEGSTTSQLPLVLCFKLGRALRYGDVESFFQIYDSLAPMEELGVSNTTFELQVCYNIQ